METVICFICYSFIASVICAIFYFAYVVYRDNEVIKYYTIAALTIMAIVLSLSYIAKYNKKYIKNDSNTSKRQNVFFFESDIRRQEERYSNRRNVDQ
jgi:hypothetical protein